VSADTPARRGHRGVEQLALDVVRACIEPLTLNRHLDAVLALAAQGFD
jgi:hypothetical protein